MLKIDIHTHINTRSNLLANAALEWLALKRKDFE
jgi:hypothetical protein